ncbi:MAG: carbohydrate kinase family protein [Candidatus Zixiibacteriota bacterium]
MPSQGACDRRIGVIGSINRDSIHLADGTTVESWGGLLYSLKFLHDSGIGEIYPVANVGADGYETIMEILARFPRLRTDFVSKVPENNNHCFLYYHNQSHKCEILKGGVPPISFSQVKPVLDFDAVLVNFISGRDVRLDALEKFRARFNGVIYMDIHSMTLGRRKVDGGYRRFLRKPPYWKRYAECADILQINESEFEILTGVSLMRTGSPGFYRRIPTLKGRATPLVDAGLELFSNVLHRAECLAVTCGQRGTYLFYDRKQPKSRKISAVSVTRVYDTTGCGDAFGAGFLAEYLKSGSYIKAGKYANAVAASRCKIRGKVF